jgi:hypothetical protein
MIIKGTVPTEASTKAKEETKTMETTPKKIQTMVLRNRKTRQQEEFKRKANAAFKP